MGGLKWTTTRLEIILELKHFFRTISSILDHFSYRVDRKWCVGVPQVQFEVGRVPIESKGKNWRRRGNSWVAINPTPCALWLSQLVLEFAGRGFQQLSELQLFGIRRLFSKWWSHGRHHAATMPPPSILV